MLQLIGVRLVHLQLCPWCLPVCLPLSHSSLSLSPSMLPSTWAISSITWTSPLTLNVAAHWGAAGALAALSLVSASVSGTVALLTLSLAINAGINMGYLTNPLDLSPNFECCDLLGT